MYVFTKELQPKKQVIFLDFKGKLTNFKGI